MQKGASLQDASGHAASGAWPQIQTCPEMLVTGESTQANLCEMLVPVVS